MERANRIPSRTTPRPIFVEFGSVKARDKVLQAFKVKRKNGENLQVRVSEDLPERISRARTGFYRLLKEKIDNNKRAFFKYNYLIVEGKKYVFDLSAKCQEESENEMTIILIIILPT